jgi:hypothetical protein
MQRVFPEGWFFSHALYGMAWINVGMQSPADLPARLRAVAEARWVLSQMDTPQGLAPYMATTQVPHGVFYLGWKNRLLGGLLQLLPTEQRTPADVDRFHEYSRALGAAYRESQGANLEAYRGQAWACDNVVALSSLRLHDALFGTDHQPQIAAWLARAQAALDPESGMIPHQVRVHPEVPLETRPRGSSQVYILSFLSELDPAFGRDQYERFRQRFVVDWCGYLPVREYAVGASGRGDIDSGQLILGISPSATVVSIAAARANGDWELAKRNIVLSETIGFPWSSCGEKRFAFGQLVVVDAFLAWAKSLVPWTETSSEQPSLVSELRDSYTTSTAWRARIHGVSAVIFVVIFFAAKRCVRMRRFPHASG